MRQGLGVRDFVTVSKQQHVVLTQIADRTRQLFEKKSF
jgi:hypothetical protein